MVVFILFCILNVESFKLSEDKKCTLTFPTATNAGMIAGVTVGCIVALILIILFLVFMWTRRKDTEEDLANDIK